MSASPQTGLTIEGQAWSVIGGGGPANGDQNLLSIAEAQNAAQQHRMEHGLWAGQLQPGCEAANQHQLLQHLQQQQQAQLQQQQLSIMLGQHGSLAPLVGQQISQLSSMLPVGSSHQSPPTLNMMLGGANMAALFQVKIVFVKCELNKKKKKILKEIGTGTL